MFEGAVDSLDVGVVLRGAFYHQLTIHCTTCAVQMRFTGCQIIRLKAITGKRYQTCRPDSVFSVFFWEGTEGLLLQLETMSGWHAPDDGVAPGTRDSFSSFCFVLYNRSRRRCPSPLASDCTR